MSDFQQKDGSGVLFKNEDRETEQHPSYRGSITIGGVQYWLSAWLKESKAGKKYMSLSAQPKMAKVTVAAENYPPPQPLPEFNDDIPFAVAALVPLGGLLAYAASLQTLL